MARKKHLLSVRNLCIAVGDREVVHDVDLDVRSGEIHAIMGPNGSGKSTFVQALMGSPRHPVTRGSISFLGTDVLALKADERACLGLFLAFQYPREVSGVTLRSFLYAAYRAQQKVRGRDAAVSPLKFKKLLEACMSELRMNPLLAERSVNQGFSGGEKKKAEILQLKLLQPRLALLDETDSGLDVDALRVVADGVNALRSSHFSALLVTHYARILDCITPDYIHVMVGGRIVESGGPGLAQQLEKDGYKKWTRGL